MERRCHQSSEGEFFKKKGDSHHFFIWGRDLFHAIFHVDTSIYKPFVDFLSGLKKKKKKGSDDTINKHV